MEVATGVGLFDVAQDKLWAMCGMDVHRYFSRDF